MDLQRAVKDLNEGIYQCQLRRTSSRGYKGSPPPQSFNPKEGYVVDAWLTKDRSSIALSRRQDLQALGQTKGDFFTALAKVALAISGGSSSVVYREGGRDKYVLRLQCSGSGPSTMQNLVKEHLNEVCGHLKDFLQEACELWGGVNRVRKLELLRLADAPDPFSYFLVEVDFFFPLPAKKGFRMNLTSAGGQGWVANVQTSYDILVEGFCLTDRFDLLL